VIGGQQVSAGDTVMLVLHAVNRDPTKFPDPDRLDVRRPRPDHLAFVAGPHYCVGAALARLEGEVGIAAVVDRLGDVVLATDTIRWKPTFGRAAEEIPVRRVSGAHR
jgi:cytochrome P450